MCLKYLQSTVTLILIMGIILCIGFTEKPQKQFTEKPNPDIVAPQMSHPIIYSHVSSWRVNKPRPLATHALNQQNYAKEKKNLIRTVRLLHLHIRA